MELPIILPLSPPPPHQADVDTYCAEAKNKVRGTGAVLMCLVDNFRKVSEGCQSEMSRAVRIALWDYKPGAGLTMACDSDVTSQCPKVSRHATALSGVGPGLLRLGVSCL